MYLPTLRKSQQLMVFTRYLIVSIFWKRWEYLLEEIRRTNNENRWCEKAKIKFACNRNKWSGETLTHLKHFYCSDTILLWVVRTTSEKIRHRKSVKVIWRQNWYICVTKIFRKCDDGLLDKMNRIYGIPERCVVESFRAVQQNAWQGAAPV